MSRRNQKLTIQRNLSGDTINFLVRRGRKTIARLPTMDAAAQFVEERVNPPSKPERPRPRKRKKKGGA